MATGIVKFYNSNKGYGFIKVDGTGEEIFVHKRDLKTPIKDSDKVSFEMMQSEKGVNAINVSLL